VKDKTGGQKILIMDACVLIDFLNSDRKVFRLISDHLGTLYVASPVLDEIKEIENEQELVEIGLKVVEPETGDAMAAGGNVGPLSFQDWICLLTAKRNGFTCVTNDKKLMQTCKKEGVDTIRGLALLAKLHEAGGITTDDVLLIGREIHRSNPKHISAVILAKFEKIIEGQTGG
jgi:predicted nucleic acid-binding protein